MNPEHNLKMTNEELQSKTITFLRFPLIVGVILIHSHFKEVVINGEDLMQNGNFPIYTIISYLFSDIFSRIAVPLFFFMSGFLFFYKTPFFTKQTYEQKLKKRAKTILVPYIFWNFLVILFFFLSQTFLPELMSGNTKLICDYTCSDWLWAFWNTNMINLPTDMNAGANPICYQFWFIRDLIVVSLFSPLVYFILKKLRQYAVIGLGVLWLFDCWINVVGFSITAFFFFSAGAYFSIYKKNFVDMMNPLLPKVAVLYALFTIIQLCFREQDWCGYLDYINILVGIVLAITLSAHFLEKGTWRANSFLSEGSFFIYAYHGMPLAFVVKFLFKIMQPHSDGMILILYVVCPIIVIAIGLLFYYILKRYLPKATTLITGGR